jgi:acyl-CoA synthetase (AMP-forming)/AMP-acid ligase II
MYLGSNAAKHPDKPALIFADQDLVVTYGQLDERSNRVAHALRAWGLKPGDGSPSCSPTRSTSSTSTGPRCARAYFTPVSWHLSAEAGVRD